MKMFNLKKIIPIWVKEPIYIFLKEYRNIPFSIAKWHAICNFVNNFKLNENIKIAIYKRTHKKIYHYLYQKYQYVFAQHQDYFLGTEVPNAYIWIFWWQGETNMPELVGNCIKSIRFNCGNHPVILVTKDNYADYVNLPDYIISKVNAGKISLTHFSDILRVNLIATHGGYWLDSTIFCTAMIKEKIFKNPIYTGKNVGKDLYNISQWRWTGYAISGWKNNILFCFVRDLFDEYWKNENYLVDYYLIDYMIYMVYTNVPLVKIIIDDIENNNVNQTLLQNVLNDAYTEQEFDYIIHNETSLYKLSWKETYNKYTLAGEKTVYNKWCEYVNTVMNN